jgi:hypothetical protein
MEHGSRYWVLTWSELLAASFRITVRTCSTGAAMGRAGLGGILNRAQTGQAGLPERRADEAGRTSKPGELMRARPVSGHPPQIRSTSRPAECESLHQTRPRLDAVPLWPRLLSWGALLRVNATTHRH